MLKHTFIILSCCLAFSCQQRATQTSLRSLITSQEGLHGHQEYKDSPYLTAGDRMYVVGHQNGTFPDLGWHVPGEMGGIWDHPIKLLDGFTFGISTGSRYFCLSDAYQFTNYPIGSLLKYQPYPELEITQTQFIPDGKEGLIIEYELINRGEQLQDLVIDFTGMVDLSPVWLADSLSITDGEDIASYESSYNAWTAQDSLNDWHVVLGTDYVVKGWALPKSQCSYDRKGNGKDLMIQSEVSLAAGQRTSIRYFVAGSYTGEDNALKTYQEIKENYTELFRAKRKRYEQLLARSALSIPDQDLQSMYEWIKYNTDWLVRDVPEIGRGMSAGIPDYPWWFGTDNCYTLQGLLATGQHEEVKSTLQTILKLSKSVNENGRIIHEASTNGVVFNPGNLNTTPHFIYLLWKYYLWTGDKVFLEEHYPYIKSGIEWITQTQDKDQNGYPDGAGMMEIHGLHSEMIDVVVYTQSALKAAAQIAKTMGDDALSADYEKRAEVLQDRIYAEWWVEGAKSYADFRATKDETLSLIDAAIVRADTIDKPWAAEELNEIKKQLVKENRTGTSGYVVHHNWVVNTPLEMGIADEGKAIQALETARQYTNRFGMYVTGIDRDENQETSSKWKSFSYVGAVMTLPTGVQAISEARYGRPDQSLEYLKMLENSFSYAFPGSLYEVSPDYGMITQAWTVYAVAVPIVEYYFGIKPNAPEKTITFEPNMPSAWPEASLDNVIVGDNELSIAITENSYNISQIAQWNIQIALPSGITKASLNGEEVNLTNQQISSSENDIMVTFE